MSKSRFYSLNDEFQFGKHMGSTLREVLQCNPDYFLWCLQNLDHLELSEELIDEIKEEFPDFDGLNMLGSHLIYDYDEEDIYENRHNSYSDDWPSYEEWLIDEFDEDAETAYWNLD